MISLDVKPERTSSSPLNLSTSDEKSTLSFSDLLRGVSDTKDAKVIQNGALVLSLGSVGKDTPLAKTVTKNDGLLSLLKNEDTPLKDSKETLELNPKLAQTLSVNEIKTLVNDAKIYLKTKILQSDDYKNSQIKELPKTLKGLAKLAKVVGIDVNKITVEVVQAKEVSVKPVQIKEPVLDAKDVKTQTEVPHAKDAKTQTEALKTKDTKTQTEVPHVQDVKTQTEVPKTKEIKSTPLFKAQMRTEHTTEQIVQTKQFKIEEKTPKEKADETLKLLLRGEKVPQNNFALTSDFSVATARVLAPTTTSNATKALEQLLHGENSDTKESTTSSKTDGLTAHKADSFEVKLNEAKQMIKYLSNDVKTAIEDYKSPFTRVKIQLNPQKLGEVDLTIVQRGKNLHINVSSNNAAINTLSMNANELKTQLANSGINNASLNFNNHSDSNNSQQQQNRQNERQAEKEYNYYENEETAEEVLSSLEIIVPQYG